MPYIVNGLFCLICSFLPLLRCVFSPHSHNMLIGLLLQYVSYFISPAHVSILHLSINASKWYFRHIFSYIFTSGATFQIIEGT